MAAINSKPETNLRIEIVPQRLVPPWSPRPPCEVRRDSGDIDCLDLDHIEGLSLTVPFGSHYVLADCVSASLINWLAKVMSIATPQAPANRNQKRAHRCLYEESSLLS